MTEAKLTSLHPLHYVDRRSRRSLQSPSLHGSFYLNLPHVSRSPELSRGYQVGDPIRLIDWKAFARNDQLIVREERDEAMANIVIALDARDTMFWPDQEFAKEMKQTPASKFSIASRIAFHLVHRHVRFGDRVRLVLIEDHTSPHDANGLELRSASHVLSFFEDLQAADFDRSKFLSFLSPLQEPFFTKTHLLFLISDGCQGDISPAFFSQAQRTCFYHILSHWECDPSWFQDRTCYFDKGLAVTLKEFLGSSLKRKNAYLSQLNRWKERVEKEVESLHGFYAFLTDESSIHSYMATLEGDL